MSKGTKRYSSTQERRLAASRGGQAQPGSGAINVASLKADVKFVHTRSWKLLIEGKTTMCDSHQEGVRSKSIKKDWLNIVKQQAREGGYDLYALAFSFDNRKDYYVLEDIDFNNLYQAVTEQDILIQQLQARIKELEQENAALQNNSHPKYFNINTKED